MSSSSSLGTGTPRSSLSSVSSFGLTGLSKFEKDVHSALNRGLSDCKNMRHWHVVQVPNRTGGTKVWTDVEIKPHRQILQMMAPGKAKCSCEREACQWAWVPGNWNHKGMFQTQWVLSGTEEKGIPMDDKRDRGRPARKVFPVYHSLTDRKLNKLSERFPEWLFIGMYGTSHDHPLAHYSTKVASERLMAMLPAGTAENPKIYIDLNGNPQSNKLFMARNPGIQILTLVECITPKDFIRKATKWGAKFDADGTQNYWDDTHVRDIPRDMEGMGESISGFISIHTTYYYDAQEIAALLNWAPNAVLYAATHRFEGMYGSLNDGEQEWEKVPTSFGYRVNQKNVATGEAYEHPDNAWMYDYDSRICGSNAFGWTMNQLCDETFLFMMVACPVTQARMSSKVFMEDTNRPVVLRAGDKPQTKDEMAANRRIDVSLCGVKTSVPIKPRLVPFFDEMRKTAIDKGRGPKEYKDHVSRCKVAAKGLLADKGVELDSQELEDIIRFSFIIDFEQQFSNVSHLFGTSFTKVVQADYMYKHGSSMVTSGTMALLMDIAMSAVESKTIQKAGVKALQHTVAHASRRGVLNTIN